MATTPVITRPNRTVVISPGAKAESAVGQPSYSPQALFNSALSLNSPPMSPNQLVPRTPVVHFFICDYGNAKVKTVSDQFIDLLVSNGIKVFTERYATHQPGFQVRAASLNSAADFFFQIHSKTAGRSHVRLYFGGQPKRMTIEESVSDVWSWWRLMSGAISKNEIDLLSHEKINYALKCFAGLDSESLNINELQKEIRGAVAAGSISTELLDKIGSYSDHVLEGKKLISMQKQMCIEWQREPGSQLSRCLPMPVVRGLSQPLKELLLSMIDQTLAKLQSLSQIVKKYGVTTPPPADESHPASFENGPEVEISIEGQQPGLSWGTLLESVQDESFGMNHITSYGDMTNPAPGSLRPPFFLDEF